MQGHVMTVENLSPISDPATEAIKEAKEGMAHAKEDAKKILGIVTNIEEYLNDHLQSTNEKLNRIEGQTNIFAKNQSLFT